MWKTPALSCSLAPSCWLRQRPTATATTPWNALAGAVLQQGDAEVTITEMAQKLGANDHEISIGFSQRMPRVFV